MSENQAKAIAKHVRTPPRKARLAANLIRGMDVESATTQLNFCNLKPARFIKKTLDSAIANAEMQLDARRDQLHVLEIRVDEGAYMKRAKSKSKGGKAPILKRTSHITVVVGEKEKGE